MGYAIIFEDICDVIAVAIKTEHGCHFENLKTLPPETQLTNSNSNSQTEIVNTKKTVFVPLYGQRSNDQKIT